MCSENIIITVTDVLLDYISLGMSKLCVADVLSGYVNVILAGLSGSPEMICGTMLALTRIVYQYKGKPILASPWSVASFFDTSLFTSYVNTG